MVFLVGQCHKPPDSVKPRHIANTRNTCPAFFTAFSGACEGRGGTGFIELVAAYEYD